jgi:excisionase family DNA binding protein
MMMGTKVTAFPELLTVREAAELMKVKPDTVWGQVKAGRVPHTRHGRRVYILKAELAKQLRAASRKGVGR